MKRKRKKGRQKKRREDNIKEWTGIVIASSTRAAENRTRWKGTVANSSVGTFQDYGIEQNRIKQIGWIDNLQFYVHFKGISIILGRWEVLIKWNHVYG